MDCEWDDGKVFFFFIIMIIKGAVVVSCCSLLLLLLLSVGSCFCCCLWLALFAGQFVKKDNHLKMKMNVEPSWRSLPPASCHLPATCHISLTIHTFAQFVACKTFTWRTGKLTATTATTTATTKCPKTPTKHS